MDAEARVTLRYILERANACEPMRSAAEHYIYFDDFWKAITDPEWLTWLLRHAPDEFEDSRRDLIEVAHALAVARAHDVQRGMSWSDGAADLDSCKLIRLYVRLRSR